MGLVGNRHDQLLRVLDHQPIRCGLNCLIGQASSPAMLVNCLSFVHVPQKLAPCEIRRMQTGVLDWSLFAVVVGQCDTAALFADPIRCSRARYSG